MIKGEQGLVVHPVASTPSCRGHGFDPWLGNKDPTCHKAWSKKKKERKERNRGSSVVKQVAVIGDANL